MLLLITIPLMILTFVFTLFAYTQMVRLKVQKLVSTTDDAGSISSVKSSAKDLDISALTGNSLLAYANVLTAGSVNKSLKVYKGLNDKLMPGKLTGQYFDRRINGYKWFARFGNVATVGLFAINTVYSVILILTFVSLLSVTSLISTGILFETNIGSKAMGTATSSAGTGGEESKQSSGNSVSGSTEPPPGTDVNDWNSADELGQRIARTAYDAATMSFPSAGNPADASADGGLRYQQGNTPIGVYDCSVFVSAVLESNGILSNGGKREGGNYDFNTMKKSDLKNYEYTGQELISWSKLASPVARQDGSNNWYKSLKPGDLIVDSNHVAVYVGKNEAGKGVIAHAASPGASYIFNDMAQTKSTYDVGLNDENTFNQLFSGAVVYRPSQMYGG